MTRETRPTDALIHHVGALLILLLQATPSRSAYQLTADTSKRRGFCSNEFLSFTLDNTLLQKHWGRVDFSAKKMHNLLSALAPCDVVVSGDLGDISSSQQGSEQNGISQSPESERYQFYSSGLTVDDLFHVYRAGLIIYADLSRFRDSNGILDVLLVKKFLNQARNRTISFAGFYLSHVPDTHLRKVNYSVPARSLVQDFLVLKKILAETEDNEEVKLFGPNTKLFGNMNQSIVYLQEFINAGAAQAVDGISVKFYYKNCFDLSPDDIVSTSMFDSARVTLEMTKHVLESERKDFILHLSGTSACPGAGAINLSDTYATGFMWLNTLGVAALLGFSRVFRQTLLGGFTGLISSTTHNPNPHYYLTVLYKHLIEGFVFEASVWPPVSELRVFCGCAGDRYGHGALSFYYLNVGSKDLLLNLPNFSQETLHLFILTPGDRQGLRSRFIKLNDKVLEMIDSVPQMLPAYTTGSFQAKSLSYGFVVVPNAKINICNPDRTVSSSSGRPTVLPVSFVRSCRRILSPATFLDLSPGDVEWGHIYMLPCVFLCILCCITLF